MWMWRLDSAIWVTTAHKALEGVFDGTYTQVWAWMTNKCRTRRDRRELYNVRDLPRGRGAEFCSLGGGAQIPPSCPWWVRPDGNSYPRSRSSFPRIVSPSNSVFLVPTRSSLTSTLTVVSSKPSSWTHFLQIHCNGSVGPRTHPSMGPVWKSRPYISKSELMERLENELKLMQTYGPKVNFR